MEQLGEQNLELVEWVDDAVDLEEVKVAVVGDMGRAQFESGDVIASLSSHAAANSYEFLWFLGDIGYADDRCVGVCAELFSGFRRPKTPLMHAHAS